MSKQPTPSHEEPLLDTFSRRYRPLYRSLLILSSIGALASIVNLLSLPTIFASYQDQPLYASLGIVNTLVIIPISLIAITLLWKKNPEGLRLKLIAYAMTIALNISLMFTVVPVQEPVVNQLVATYKQQGLEISKDDATKLIHTSARISFGFSIFISLIMAWLWLRAWKAQMSQDQTPNKKTVA